VINVPEEVRKFIARYVDSIESLEVLLHLQKQAEREWTAGEIASELRIGTAAADSSLAKLCSVNLLDVRIGTDLFYRYNPRLPHLEHAASALAAAYEKHRLAVIKLILERPAEPLRSFAEAFRFTKKDESDG
jgi:hypothetical protein